MYITYKNLFSMGLMCLGNYELVIKYVRVKKTGIVCGKSCNFNAIVRVGCNEKVKTLTS